MNQSKKPGRRPASGTAAAAADAMQQAAAGWPKPPKTLRASELTFWQSVMIARLPQQWAEVDLLHAANLARSLADLEVQRKALLRERAVIDGRLNPRHALVEMLHKRTVYLTRMLQLQAVATIGAAQKQIGTKGEAAAAAAALKQPSKRAAAADTDALLARPPRLQ